MAAIAPSETPTPMPAFPPVLRPVPCIPEGAVLGPEPLVLLGCDAPEGKGNVGVEIAEEGVGTPDVKGTIPPPRDVAPLKAGS